LIPRHIPGLFRAPRRRGVQTTPIDKHGAEETLLGPCQGLPGDLRLLSAFAARMQLKSVAPVYALAGRHRAVEIVESFGDWACYSSTFDFSTPLGLKHQRSRSK
jgi:hypothetical protein